jgi:hypothetical protein
MTKPKKAAPTLKTAALTKESIFTADMVDVKVGANVDYFLPEPSFTISSVQSQFGKASIKNFVLAELKEHLMTAIISAAGWSFHLRRESSGCWQATTGTCPKSIETLEKLLQICSTFHVPCNK